MFIYLSRTNGDPPTRALHTAEEICNCKWYNRPKYFNGTLDAIVKISRTEGISSLWSGLSPTLVLAVPTTMIYFTAYEKLKFVINGQYVKYQQLRGVTQDAAASPMWASLTAGRSSFYKEYRDKRVGNYIISPIERRKHVTLLVNQNTSQIIMRNIFICHFSCPYLSTHQFYP